MQLRVLAVCGVLLLSACSPAPGANPSAWHLPQASAPVPSAPVPPAPASEVAKPVPITYPAHGSGRWKHASAQSGPAAGQGGRLLRYRVLVERDIGGLPPNAFADTVTATLADPRGWTAGGRWRLQRVGPGSPYDFTIYLATPGTRDPLCGDASDGYTSCRNAGKVVLNVARWVKGVPHYGAGLATYRQYMVNHEVGHRLGQGHELCPGPGEPAPVMQQQTLGLHDCTANAWPYLHGERYAGVPGAYDDEVPARDPGRR
ncbi:DUF3152 domain-containing protein [Actinoplanes sp. TFC3]|uniref:DUF3152 domain-containing protein n=1 Tax=Actinoplanes sp. TFC3 TaxID=1710355 RepID=UPI00083168AA|nr:DUF3152 domain-containing protein [Actinoplanes sp. TFC3]